MTREEKECFVNLIVLYPKKGEIVMEGGVFVLANRALPHLSDAKRNSSKNYKEFRECLKTEKKKLNKKLKDEDIKKMYTEMCNSRENTFPISRELQGQLR